LRGIIESFSQAEDVTLSPSVEIDSISAILKLVHESDFCTVLPRVAVRRQLEHEALHGSTVTSPRLSRQIVCVTHPRRPPSPAAAAFIATLVRYVRGLGEGDHAGSGANRGSG
jgi:DNA-binding transcriptional LysR family regulator